LPQSPYITNFIKTLIELPLHKVPEHIASFPHNWPFPRGDLYHWIAPLNRFDRILEGFTTVYALDKGPQTQPFELRLLQKGDAEDGTVTEVSAQELVACGYSADGDRELVESVLNFTRILLERCGNRSLYASSAHLNHLLNTVSLSLLKITLRVSLRLAQRYHTSRMRVASPHSLNALLAGHYSINLDRIQKLANPFPKKPVIAPVFAQTPAKNKEKEDAIKPGVNTSDIESLVKAKDVPASYKDELSSVHLTYYDKTDVSAPASSVEARAPNTPGSPMPPVTPTPVRRTSNLGPGSARSERVINTTDAPETPVRAQQPENPSTGPKTFELSSAQLSGSEAWKVMEENVAKVPEDNQYDLLQRVRVASAFQTSRAAVHDLVAVRILAISNLSYVYGETTFHQRIGQPDSEEPRRTQLAQQLTDMLQPASPGQEEISREMMVIVIQALEALAKCKSKTSEIANALNITVSHGVLFYVLRKILATLGDEEASGQDHEWCKDVFELVMTLTPAAPHPQRNADALVAAGFVGILVDILKLRTKQAEIYFPIALGFFDNFIHNGVRDAFQAIVNAKGLDTLADLTAFEVQRSLEAAQKQEGLPTEYKTKITDFQIPFNSQQTLRQLLKFVAHMYHHNLGTDDRLLRNFVDSPQLLGALRTIFDNASIFGSNVWSGAMNILSSFIHNEPTSYQVIAEAGLSKGFLEAVTQQPITVSDVVVEDAEKDGEEISEDKPEQDTTEQPIIPEDSTNDVSSVNAPKALGILPVGETMREIPTAFGAICLNENGMRMFQASQALEKFLEIFESPEHVKAMEEDAEVPQYIGTAFDELVRHHPQLKERTSNAVVGMVRRVKIICQRRAETKGVGAKLWLQGDQGLRVAGGRDALSGLSDAEVENAYDTDDTNFSARTESAIPVTESELENDALVKGRGGGQSSSDFIAMVCRFLGGFLSNHSMASAFCEAAGAEILLDMATAACNPYNFHETLAQQELIRVLQQLVEHKAHLILPSLARRTQLAYFQLRPLAEHQPGKAYFSDLTEPTTDESSQNDLVVSNATYTAKAMVQAQFLCHVFSQVFSMHVYHAGRTVPHHFFGQVNLTDIYTDLIDDLGQLYSSCVWEAITMRNNMPEDWKKQIHISGMSFDHSEADNVMGLSASSSSPSNNSEAGATSDQQDGEAKKVEARNTAQFKNCQILASLSNQVSTGILSFFQAVGKSLLWKHSSRTILSDYQRQNASKMAEHLARALVSHIAAARPSTMSEVDRVAYDIVVLTSTLQTLVDERKTTRTGGTHREVFSLVLLAFYQKGGFKELEKRLQQFGKLIEQHKEASQDTSTSEQVTSAKRIYALALAGIDKILEFYNKISHSKNITDAQQTTVMAVRDRQKSDFFMGAQFVVELRNAVLPQISQMWKSSVMEALPAHSVKSIVDLLKLILEGEGESNAVKRSENLKRRIAAEPRKFKIRTDSKEALQADGHEDEELCIEALYRCNNNVAAAKEYYVLRRDNPNMHIPLFPLPMDEEAEPPVQETSNDTTNQTAASGSVPSVEMQDADEAGSSTQDTDGDLSEADLLLGNGNRRLVLPPDMLNSGLAEVLSNALGGGEELMRALPVHRRPSDEAQRPVDVVTEENFVTIDDLDDKRKDIKDGLIDRCLDVLNTHTDVTFELADLITAAIMKAGQDQSTKVEIGETLVNSLMSLRPDEDTPIEGKKIASYAHLLALVMQDREFFNASLDTLTENFEYFGGFIKMFQGQKPDETSPWVSNVLLIIERVLAEDEKPQQIQWTVPPFEDPYKEQDLVELRAPVVSDEKKTTVFDALVEILPKIGKDETLALSVTRTLVILTRRRSLAKRLGEKLSISRLFVMMKQLAGVAGERLQSTFLILLRHIIEDDETIRQIMRTEIQSTFESKGMARSYDTTLYTRTLYHLALRSPEIFVEVTNEKVQLSRWDQNRPGGAQPLMLKKVEKVQEAEKVEESTETEASTAPERPAIERTKTGDLKPPSIENPDGVIQFLLKELSSYKDVEDKEVQPTKPAYLEAPATATSSDVEMSDSTPTPVAEPVSTPSTDSETKQPDIKPVFKADQHPIFAYRCFILHCLVELLGSYNRTKVEFINFSRKAEHQVSTPSKPRSGLLNYFLTSLIPLGSLTHPEDIPSKKQAATANWAINTIVSLCSKTSERVIGLKISTSEEESDLAYVRKFVLEHALKAYKDAMTCSEPLDQKYARLLSLSNLFYRMLTGKQQSGINHSMLEMVTVSQKQLGRFMYEKNFITALTSSIAELDLNFPGAKRAVKYILRPLKLLTDIGVTLSISGDVSAPGTTEDDEISSATSVSDDDNEREETPDLFRNSTLGMFETANSDDDEDESGSDEAEEYYEGDEYGEEMDYDEYEEGGPGMHEGDVVSDEDDDIDGMGPIEGLPGDIDVEVDMDEDESGDDDDDSDMDEADSDEGDDIEIIDEITGDDENASMEEDDDDEDDDEEDWDDDDDDDGEDPYHHGALPMDALVPAHGGPFGGAVVLEDDGSDVMDQMEGDDPIMTLDMGGPEQYFEDEMGEDDEDNEEDEDEEVLGYEPEHDDPEGEEMEWGWETAAMPSAHQWRRPGGPFYTMEDPPLGLPRSHRGVAVGGGDQDGTNPLLQRSDRRPAPGGPPRPGDMPDWLSQHRPRLGGQDGLSFVSDLIQMVGPSGARISVVDGSGGLAFPPGALPGGIGGMPPAVFHIAGSPGRFGLPDIRAIQRITRGLTGRDAPLSGRSSSTDPGTAVSFTPTLTTLRWQEEARLLFGHHHLERAMKLVDSLLRLLVPPAMEAKRQKDKADTERRAAEEKAREEQRQKEEEERLEREAREQREREEREAKEAEEAEARAREAAERGETTEGTESMEGVEQPAGEDAAEAAPRVMTNIRGREVDITHLGIDLEYLDALPDDMREEVIMQQFQEQRSQERTQDTTTGQPSRSSEINREFLDALPPDIQAELLASEAADRRRRERDEQRRRAAASGNAAPQAGDMDMADFFATLNPALRQQVLLDADAGTLAGMPAEFQAEARTLLGRIERHRNGRPERPETNRPQDDQDAPEPEEQRVRRPVIQMLDKSGVATLLRLMFVAMQDSARTTMQAILSDICKNTQNRAEVISVLLSILQDGSSDANALEKSFAHLTLRAKQMSGQKTPQPLKRSLTGSQFTSPSTDVSPLMIVQQCLSTLTHLANENPRVSSFFLSEHETSISQRAKSLKKGKGKESKSAKYPLNALLTLLDRKSIIENSSVMEALAALLIRVTEPLKILLKKAKDAEKEKERAAEAGATASTDVPMTEGETSATTDDPVETDKPREPVTKSEEKKKHKDLTPPEVPEENLRLVVNIIAARECNGKTFQSTLDIINHLSAIPGAKDTFGKELVHRAQDLGDAVLVDLQQLAPQIQNAKTSTDIQGIALANFSPASSHQSKLLRVLLALDYLFDPKRSSSQDRQASASADGKARQDLLSTLYETSTFAKLWSNLSDCLTAIRERGSMNNVATILQPLIESFMVVCKNTTSKEANLAASQELTIGTPQPDSRIEKLFFSFTEDHRKILNDLVRNNPKLLNGTFDVLAKNSKVLEFDNKRNYFTRRMHTRSPEDRIAHPSVQLNIRREQIFLDSFKNLYFKSANEIKYGKLNIRFHGEEGVDAGGVTREWFAALSRQMFNPDYALFNPVASDRTTFHPNPMSGINEEHLTFFKFVGRIIGKAMYEGRVLDCHFSRAVYRRILGKPVSLKDMETLDLDYYKSLCWILENDITDVTFETFSVEVDSFGETETVDLIENGRDIPVTEENKQEYVRLVVEHRLIKSVEEQLEHFLKGKSRPPHVSLLRTNLHQQASTRSSLPNSFKSSTSKNSNFSSPVSPTSTSMTGRTTPNTTTTSKPLHKSNGSGVLFAASTRKKRPSFCNSSPVLPRFHSMASRSLRV
jgi:E3 ubiquitin-protein ligase HUWE1